MKAKSSCRLRKVCCQDCGYTIRMARSWMERGLPVCPCGSGMVPDSPADMAWCGLIGQEDVSGPDWTAICRENGWEDLIIRKGAAAKSWSRRRAELRSAHADFCAYTGCGRWVAAGETHCHDHAPALEATPF